MAQLGNIGDPPPTDTQNVQLYMGTSLSERNQETSSVTPTYLANKQMTTLKWATSISLD